MDSRTIIIGNIVGLVGSALMVVIGLIKTKKKILIVQIVQTAVFALSNFILGGVSGVIVNAVTVIRNVFVLKKPFTLPAKLFFIAAQVVLAFLFRSEGIIYWLPVMAGCIFTYFLDSENDMVIKIAIAFAQAMWAVYDFSIMNFTTFAFDVFAIISNIVGIVLLNKERHTDST